MPATLALWMVGKARRAGAQEDVSQERAAVTVETGRRKGKAILPCSSSSKCVSTASFNRPSQYASPWIVPSSLTIEEASKELKQALEDVGSTVVDENAEHAGGMLVTARAQGWGEDMKFLLKEDPDIGGGGAGLVTFRIEGAQMGKGFGIPDPPGCFEKGCIR